ncbi:MAG: T9SS C-terminal target domain-containing protein [Stygiobacter sp.]|nr:MAG: T9SS C-terminal target domain-containing protein [Stygiobacter sp.]
MLPFYLTGKRIILSFIFVLLTNVIIGQNLIINEFMASNSKTILDKDFNSYSDWIEIYNSGSSPINLKNYYVTDDLVLPTKYQINIDIIIAANGYVLLWADDANTGIHTNFKLGGSGESIGLFDANAQLVDTVNFGEQQTDVSQGRLPSDPNSWAKFSTATPGKANLESGIYNLLPPLTVSHQSGFYNSSVNIGITHSISDVTIRYTIDGSVPSVSSKIYQTSLQVDSNSVLRFRAFKNGYSPSITETRTYFINEKTDLPVFSLVTDPANFFSDTTGIYVIGTRGVTSHCSTGPRNWNQDWERPVSLEFFETNKELAFKVNTGVKIYGGCTRLYAQKSLAFYMRSEYGDDKLRYRLFDDAPISEFNNFILRSSGQDWWRTMFRDGMVQTLLEQGMKLDYSNYRPSVLFINGKYWGIHNIREKMNEYYAFYHHGANINNIDLIEISKSGRATSGDSIAYNEMINFLATKNMADPANYVYIKSIVDIDEYIDYQIAEIYGANGDWPGSNMKLWRERKAGGKWRWMIYDMDFTFGGNAKGMFDTNTLAQATLATGTSWPNPSWSTLMLRKLLENVEFKNEFIQRFAAHMNTTFEKNHVLAVIDSMARDIASEVPRHKLRWSQSISYGTGWQSQIDIMKTFAEKRPSFMREHIYAKFGVTTSHSLVISRNNPAWGKVFVYSVEMKKNSATNIFFKGIPLRIKALALPGYRFLHWEGVSNSTSPEISITLESNTTLTAIFAQAVLNDKSVVINEINYNCSSVFDTEDWIELYNPDDKNVDLSNWILRDSKSNQHVSAAGITINAKGYLVFCRDTVKFKKQRPNVKNIIGNFGFGLSSDDEQITLLDSSNKIIDEVGYSSSGLWSSLPNGKGSTLSLIDPQLDNSQASNWKASQLYGTPGYLNDVYTEVEKDNALPKEFGLYQNYPNPFNPETTISFSIPKSSHITLKVFDVLGREVATLIDEYKQAGTYYEKFNVETRHGASLHSGVYFYQLRADNFTATKKLVLIK